MYYWFEFISVAYICHMIRSSMLLISSSWPHATIPDRMPQSLIACHIYRPWNAILTDFLCCLFIIIYVRSFCLFMLDDHDFRRKLPLSTWRSTAKYSTILKRPKSEQILLRVLCRNWDRGIEHPLPQLGPRTRMPWVTYFISQHSQWFFRRFTIRTIQLNKGNWP